MARRGGKGPNKPPHSPRKRKGSAKAQKRQRRKAAKQKQKAAQVKAKKQQKRKASGKGKARGRQGPRKTRATKIHREARTRIEEIERALRRELRIPGLGKARRKELREGLAKAKRIKEEQAKGERVAAPVGRVGRKVELDHYRGGSRSYPDTRQLYNGNQLLGYLEGRAEAITVLGLQPHSPNGIPEGWAPPPPPQAVQDRIAQLSQVTNLGEADRQAMVDRITWAWQVCDWWGAEVLFEIDYESQQT